MPQKKVLETILLCLTIAYKIAKAVADVKQDNNAESVDNNSSADTS